MRIEQGKVADDDGHREGYGEHPGDGAQRSDEHPGVGLRDDVTVPERRHGNDGPPQSDGDRHEVVVLVCLDAFGVVGEWGEDDDADDEEVDEHEEFAGARLERVDEHLQTRRVLGQSEQTQYHHQVYYVADVISDAAVVEDVTDYVGDARDDVDDVVRAPGELFSRFW